MSAGENYLLDILNEVTTYFKTHEHALLWNNTIVVLAKKKKKKLRTLLEKFSSSIKLDVYFRNGFENLLL